MKENKHIITTAVTAPIFHLVIPLLLMLVNSSYASSCFFFRIYLNSKRYKIYKQNHSQYNINYYIA